MKNLEHKEQTIVIEWFDRVCSAYNLDHRCLFAIPNGGKRHIRTATLLKSEGVRPGIPDLFLAVPAHGKHGLFIEMKAKVKTARVSPHQKEIINIFSEKGFEVCVCYGADKAITTIKHYLETENT